METNLLDRMLDAYLAEKTPVTVTLQNKIRVSGKIRAFDSYVIVMDGQKREIVYRHAVSCISPSISAEQKRRPAAESKPAAAKTATAVSSKSTSPKHRTARVQAISSAAKEEQSLNNSMKDGLLRWMQEQKAAK
jgi:RNA chaperone Hfq